MKVLNSKIDIDLFFQSLKSAAEKILLLDYDGTLAPFRIERDQAFPYDKIPGIIDDIIANGATRVVVISGRRIRDLIPLLKLKKLPEIWGSHGWEWLAADGTYTAFEIPRKMCDGLVSAATWLEEIGYTDKSEFKHGCLAFHWRGLDKSEIPEIDKLVTQGWIPIARRNGLSLRRFDGGIELRAPGNDKGEVVKKILSGTAKAVISYLGDDDTDEDAFRALGPAGLGVLVNREFRATAADIWLKPPDELIDFLIRWKASS
jgi:trehalose-phosphatase